MRFARTLGSIAIGWLVTWLCAPAVGAQVRIDERVDVARVLVDVRVTNSKGEPIRGLTAESFAVELDGTAARLQSATWVGLPPRNPGATSPASQAPAPAYIPRGRLMVFLFQHSFEPSRINGLLRMMSESARFVAGLQPGDRAAVVAFDTRLRIWQDFTANTRRLKEVLGQEIIVQAPADQGADDVSLAAALDPARAARAATPEAALEVLAAALSRIDGPKSVVLFGHGFGTYQPIPGSLKGRAVLGEAYARARDALVAAQVTVFALDVTDADEHTLEMGLMAAADDTGGFYERTEFPSLVMDRLAGALEGYYLLAVETTAGERRRSVRVRVNVPGASVLARRFSGE